jgi:hypothetical protein
VCFDTVYTYFHVHMNKLHGSHTAVFVTVQKAVD